MPPSWSRAPQRGRRLTRSELRTRVLDAAAEFTAAGGLSVSPFHVNVEELLRRAGVPRSSAFVAFGGKEGLITELIVRLLEQDAGADFSPETRAVVRRTVESSAHLLVDRAGRDAVLWECVRLGVEQNFRDVLASPGWRTSTAISVSWSTIPDAAHQRIADAMKRSAAAYEQSMADFYASLLDVFARRPGPGVDLRMIASANAAAVEGAAQRALLSGDIEGHRIERVGLDGRPVSWHPVALTCRAIFEGLTEPV